MKAVILRERPIGIYYELPIFESNPRYCINWPDITLGGLPKKTNSSKKCEYSLIFESTRDDILDELRTFGPLDLTDREMYLINENYFYLLDHPDIKECEINLV